MKTIILGTAILLSLLIYRTINDTAPRATPEYWQLQRQIELKRHAETLLRINANINQ